MCATPESIGRATRQPSEREWCFCPRRPARCDPGDQCGTRHWSTPRTQEGKQMNHLDYEKVFSNAVETVREGNRYRVFATLERLAGQFPYARNHGPGPSRVVVWCSNDYLAQGQNPEVLEALSDAALQMGAGSGGTRNISGTHCLHGALERELADLHGTQAALLFTSGYIANAATLALVGKLLPGCEIFSDALNHASMIDGIKQSGCVRRIFRHNDVAHLEQLLRKADPERPKLIAFESVYSMD